MNFFSFTFSDRILSAVVVAGPERLLRI